MNDRRKNEEFSLLTCLDTTTFVFLSVFTVIETLYLKNFTKPLPMNAKRPLPVAFPSLKLPTVCSPRWSVQYNCACELLWFQISAKYKEWQELVPQLIAGDIKKLTGVVDAHHRREKMLSSLRSRYESSYFYKKIYLSQCGISHSPWLSVRFFRNPG